GMSLVVKPQPLMVPAGARDHGQNVRIRLRADRWHRQRVGLESTDLVAQPRWKHLLQLRQRADRGFLDARDRAVRGGTQSDRDRDRFLVVEQQWWQGTARAEPVPAVDARPRV